MPRQIPEDERRCTAIAKQTGERCKNYKSTSDDGKQWPVCRFHGARGGAPKKNKNAVTTGEHETIWLDTLDVDEQLKVSLLKLEVMLQVDDAIRLVSIREYRMMKRIQHLRADEYDLVTTQEAIRSSSKEGMSRENIKHPVLEQIQAIEEALTRVQKEKIKLLELKYKLENSNDPEDDGALSDLLGWLDKSRKKWKLGKTQGEAKDEDEANG